MTFHKPTRSKAPVQGAPSDQEPLSTEDPKCQCGKQPVTNSQPQTGDINTYIFLPNQQQTQ